MIVQEAWLDPGVYLRPLQSVYLVEEAGGRACYPSNLKTLLQTTVR
jgi:hypothetical protein